MTDSDEPEEVGTRRADSHLFLQTLLGGMIPTQHPTLASTSLLTAVPTPQTRKWTKEEDLELAQQM